MKIKMKLALMAALGTLALAAHAQDAGGPPPDNDQNGGPGGGGGRHHPPIPAIVRALDANHDGIIDSNEIANASAALATLDKNGDGKLTWNEYMGRPHGRPGGSGPDADSSDSKDNDAPPGPPPGDDSNGGPGGNGHHHPPVPPIVRALDVNHDGVIDSNEIANASAALKTLDKNGDGQLTRDEYMGKRPGPPPDADDGPGGGGPPPEN